MRVRNDDDLVVWNQVDDAVREHIGALASETRDALATAIEGRGIRPFPDEVHAVVEVITETVAESCFLVVIPGEGVQILFASGRMLAPG